MMKKVTAGKDILGDAPKFAYSNPLPLICNYLYRWDKSLGVN